jgi:multidrug efflux pump subunit AcrB
MITPSVSPEPEHAFTNRIVKVFLESNLSVILILLAVIVGLAALGVTPREEDPQIVVPLADVYVNFPGHSAAEVEKLVSTRLEKMLYQIDGVEYVYSMSREDQAIITVRFYVGEDRERSLVKLYKKIDENVDLAPPGVTGWVVKPVEIDDVPVVTLTLAGRGEELGIRDWGLEENSRASRQTSDTLDHQIPGSSNHLIPNPQSLIPSSSPDDMTLRRVAEEVAQRLAGVPNVSRAYVVGGRPRVVQVMMDPDAMAGYHVSPLEIRRAIQATNIRQTAGQIRNDDRLIRIEAGQPFTDPRQLSDLVVGVFNGRPVFLKDVATIEDGPDEVSSYVRHGWGPARGFTKEEFFPSTVIGHEGARDEGRGVRGEGRGASDGNKFADSTTELQNQDSSATDHSPLATRHSPPVTGHSPLTPNPSEAVTIAVAKKKGTNAVWVANAVLHEAEKLQETIVPDDMQMIVTRNYGLTANEKVNELVEALAVAVLIVVALLTLGLGWREALIVAVAVPVVFGLTLAVNLMLGFTINRVTLFALILSLGLLVDDPIVDVENIVRHFALRKRATRRIVLEAVAEIRPPLITATLAVIVSFLPMFFITGMMGPYMRPMALNVPVTMLMSMLVAFTITPWLAYHVLRRKYSKQSGQSGQRPVASGQSGTDAIADHQSPIPDPQSPPTERDPHDLDAIKQSLLYKFFYPLMAPLLHSRLLAWGFLLFIALLTVGAMGLAAVRSVPLKMLPFDNKNELLLVLDFDRGTTLERSDAAVRDFEAYLATVPEVSDYTSYVGLASPMDFNGLVRHYYLRQGDDVAEMRINLAGKKNRRLQSHAVGLRMRRDLQDIADRHHARMKLVETPPGPPVIASVVAEVYGRPDDSYDDILRASDAVRNRLAEEPGVVDVDSVREAAQEKLTFVPDSEKAAINDVSSEQIAATLRSVMGDDAVSVVRSPTERNSLKIVLRVPVARRSSPHDLARIEVKGNSGKLVPLAELGKWKTARVDQMIYHKNLERVAYVFAETAGRPPADVVVDVMADRVKKEQSTSAKEEGSQATSHRKQGLGTSDTITRSPDHQIAKSSRPVGSRTFFHNGSGLPWSLPSGASVDFAGEGEWKITLDVFRDLGLAFGAAMVGIYVLLVAQMRSFAIPIVVMLAIPLTVLGVMPGFWLLNVLSAHHVGGYLDPVYFTATGMIGMIALSGIVTRDSIILVDFIHLSLARGRSLFDAIMESRVVRLRPILLTAAAAMLGAAPIIVDPIFSGLAWSLIFGLFASTLFTLFVIPVAYWLLYANKPGHGLPQSTLDEV